jgi:hypothetical protein
MEQTKQGSAEALLEIKDRKIKELEDIVEFVNDKRKYDWEEEGI